jgi:hypothetical protein
LLHIQAVTGSNLGLDIGYSEILRGFPQQLLSTTVKVSYRYAALPVVFFQFNTQESPSHLSFRMQYSIWQNIFRNTKQHKEKNTE